MLLAEIHGKRFREAEGQEDWLTSAVFGHLRHIPPKVFWSRLFGRALSADDARFTMASVLESSGVSIEAYEEIEFEFWKNCGSYGEPDLILRFTGDGLCPIVVLIEVKLNSSKSGVGEQDQLAKYLELLHDPQSLHKWACTEDFRFVIYLTRNFAGAELEDSLALARMPDANKKLFGLEWHDLLEAATVEGKKAEGVVARMLFEMAYFLKMRGFEAFKGFRISQSLSELNQGSFYNSGFFMQSEWLKSSSDSISGRFYGN